ncbi:hypothetical protein K435DRAFT_848633 [Dendrothele bispora CBS 962.96]|uniref:Cytochrome P450 n=1 Tax=Dendrothele bispora (strain CBS 962.96) TaxID=1314807 RepID=A0A4S8MV20_DENBC|nr:hypothetical protein K435DRAFT_848633 [Dendrothele bispora CBS 962.96]
MKHQRSPGSCVRLIFAEKRIRLKLDSCNTDIVNVKVLGLAVPLIAVASEDLHNSSTCHCGLRPERWGKEPEAAHEIPGVWSHLLTFIGGARACIGWRFSVVEMKAILFTLIRAFEFDLAIPKEDVTFKRPLMVSLSRPMAKSHLPERRLPVILTPVTRDN